MEGSTEKYYSFDRYTSRPLHGFYQEPPRRVPIVGDVDVLVVGGSQSGCAAAICAARHGARVMLVERYGFLGGQSIYGSVVQWEKRAFINNLGAVATRGIAKEMLERIVAKGGSDGLWQTPPGCPEMRDGEEWLNVDAIALTLVEMCEEAGVDLLFHTMATEVMLEPQDSSVPRMAGVIFDNKTGRFAVKARVVVDATADLDLVWRAIGDEGCGMRPPQERMTAGFYVWYGGIDTEAFIDHVLRTPGYRGYPDPDRFPDKVRRHAREGKLIGVRGFADVLDRAHELGLLDPVEALLGAIDHPLFPGIYAKWVGRDRWCCGFMGLRGLNLLDVWDVTRIEVFRTKLAGLMLPVVRLTPGWGDCYIARTNLHVGGRESRYLRAVRMLREEDIFPEGDGPVPTAPDTVGRSGAHDPGKNCLRYAYPIPYGMLVPEKLDGVLCCSRAVGVEPETALDAHRGIVPTIVVGQAAGTAAALSIREGVAPRHVDLAELQAALRKDDVVLDVENVAFDFDTPVEE